MNREIVEHLKVFAKPHWRLEDIMGGSIHKVLLCALSAGLFVFSFGELRLDQIRARSVRDGKNAPVVIDTLLTETVVGGGTARTTVTMSLVPLGHRDYKWIKGDSTVCYTVEGDTTVDGESKQNCRQVNERVWSDTEDALDSVELSVWFSLPTDFAVSDMHLWVNGEPVRGLIQDKWLAREQYTEIVGVRLDPALLEYNGYGNYSLRIFPAESHKARKISITFNHTFDDGDLNLISAGIPISFNRNEAVYYASPEQNGPIGFVRASFRRTVSDASPYDVSIPGLGTGAFGLQPLILEKEDVDSLGAAVVTTVDPSAGGEYLWTDVTKDGDRVAGFSFGIAESTVVMESEPPTRIIALDMRTRMWNWGSYYEKERSFRDREDPNSRHHDYPGYENVDIWKRAQKYAVMAVAKYATEGEMFNVLLPGNPSKPVFAQPVKPTPENVVNAYVAIATAEPDSGTRSLEMVREAVKQSEDNIVILISDLMRPYNYGYNDYDTDGNYVEWIVTEEGQRFDALIDSIEATARSGNTSMFGIEDDYGLVRACRNTGGFRLASLHNTYYWAFESYYEAGERKFRANLPDLYGDNWMNRGLRGLTISSDGFIDPTYTFDNSRRYWGWWGFEDGIGLARAETNGLRKSSRVGMPYDPINTVHFAGKLRNPAQSMVTLHLSGKLNGLGFSKTLTGQIAQVLPTHDNGASDVQWAFRKSEQLASDNWYENRDSIKHLGREYHVVTRQTSLLALEPGMELWEDTTGQSEDGAENASPSLVVADRNGFGAEAAGGGTSIDSVTLEELIAGITPVNHNDARPARAAWAVRVAQGRILITTPITGANETAVVRLFDLRGREVLSRKVDLHNGMIQWNLDQARISAGAKLILNVEIGGRRKNFEILLLQ